MSDHDVLRTETIDTTAIGEQPSQTAYVTCRCGAVFHGETPEEAQERHAHHFRNPEARAGIAAARDALRGKKEHGNG